jgi:hypothetical protein
MELTCRARRQSLQGDLRRHPEEALLRHLPPGRTGSRAHGRAFDRDGPRVEKVPLGHHHQGEFHDQGDARWIVVRRSLWAANQVANPSRPVGRPEVGHPQGVMGGFIYY